MKAQKKTNKATKSRSQSHSMTCYFEEMKRFDLLSREEEIELGKRIQNGDAAARERMINSNLRLVVKIANDYSGCGLAIEDLISEGNIGLMRAAERFDPTYEVRFSTYAALWIKQGIRRALGNQSRTIRLPLHVTQKLRALDQASRELGDILGRDPTNAELAKSQGMTRLQVEQLREASQPVASLDEHSSEDGTEVCELGAIIPDEAVPDPYGVAETHDMHRNLGDVMRVLNPREREVVVSRFGLGGDDPQTLEEVGQTYGVSRERIRQIQKQAVEKLRHALQRLEICSTKNKKKRLTVPRSLSLPNQPAAAALSA